MDVSFIIMPFGSVHWPSIGVSLLQGAMNQNGFSSKVHYFSLRFADRIGLKLYDRIAEYYFPHPLVGELLFSDFAFETYRLESRSTIRELLLQILPKSTSDIINLDEAIDMFIKIRGEIPEFIDDCTDEILSSDPKLVGFSSSFYQHCACLTLAKAIKKIAKIPVIFGGANCEGEMGSTLLRCVPWVDFACSGEGDLAFIKFLRRFLSGQTCDKINGIITRESSDFEAALTDPVMIMDSLPTPEFDDYFSSLNQCCRLKDLHPEMCIETSRGCWWGEKFQCTFCGLNGSTMKYRSKSVSRVLKELRQLLNKYSIKKFHVVDNMLDLKYFDRLFPELEHEGLGIDLFYETKANLSREQLIQMKQAGVNNIQPGIESLSDKVLTIMKKGVSALLNIQLLKWCRELGIVPHWNLLYGFPDEPPEEYFRMAKLVQLLVHLYPPGAIGCLTLDRFSPYFLEPTRNGIVNVRPLQAYNFAYPWSINDVQRISYHFDYDYYDGRDPESYTKELREQVSTWKALWENNTVPTLNMVNIGKMIVINDTRPCAVRKLHLLTDEEAMAYEICDRVHSFGSLLVKMQLSYPQITESNLLQIISDLIGARLMVRNDEMYLSLAVEVKAETDTNGLR